MQEPWTIKHLPKKLQDVVGQPKAIQTVRGWAEKWKLGGPQKKKTPEKKEILTPLLLYGPPGTGKSATAFALAQEYQWDLVELNASDKRTFNVIQRVAGTAATVGTLFGEHRRLVVLDEADNVYSREDRGGYRAIEKIIEEAKNPMILIANQVKNIPWNIRAMCLTAGFWHLKQESMIKWLVDICRKEKIDAEPLALNVIVETSGGDARSALNDLQTLASGRTKLTVKDVVLYKRDREATVREVLQRLMHCQTCQEARSISWDVDLTPEDFLSWVDDNIPRMLKEPADLARIYGSISRADVYLRRTKKRQIYRMWKYVNFMSTAGVALQREGELKLSESHFPTPISMYSRTKGSRAVRDNLARKVATRCHTSRRVARKHFLPYLSAIFDKDRKSADRITMELELTDAERDSLTKLS